MENDALVYKIAETQEWLLEFTQPKMKFQDYTQELGLELRKMYEGAKIVTEQDFKEAMKYVLFDC